MMILQSADQGAYYESDDSFSFDFDRCWGQTCDLSSKLSGVNCWRGHFSCFVASACLITQTGMLSLPRLHDMSFMFVGKAPFDLFFICNRRIVQELARQRRKARPGAGKSAKKVCYEKDSGPLQNAPHSILVAGMRLDFFLKILSLFGDALTRSC
jgi:hypothetical protein